MKSIKSYPKEFGKKFFQEVWGEDGYYENFDYGVGIDVVCEMCIKPFHGKDNIAIEIGCGGGVFTERMIQRFKTLIAVDVIKMPKQFEEWFYPEFIYLEQKDKQYSINAFGNNFTHFAFAYNVFCHLPNHAITKYLKSIHDKLKPGGDFIFMLSRASRFTEEYPKIKLGEMFPMGHFYQDERTLDLVIGKGWNIIERDMIPEHRDLIIHLEKYAITE